MDSHRLSCLIAESMEEKKGADVCILDVRHIAGAVTDFFVIGTARSDIQVRAMCEHLEKNVYLAAGVKPSRKEGVKEGRWVLVDYWGVVAHLMQAEVRAFYQLEQLWGDGERMDRQVPPREGSS